MYPESSSGDRCFIDDFIKDKIERAEIAVVEVFAQFELFFVFFLTPTTSRDYSMPISTSSAIRRVHNHAQRRHLFNLPNLSSFTPSLPGGIEPQTYHEQKTLPSVLFASVSMRVTFTTC